MAALSKEAHALEVARFAICDFQERVGEVMLALEKVREAGLAEPFISPSTLFLTTTDQALDDWQEAEVRPVAEFSRARLSWSGRRESNPVCSLGSCCLATRRRPHVSQ